MLLDALRQAPLDRLPLPNRSDRRLLRITTQLRAPADGRCLSQWAKWAGLSSSNLSRHLREETGFSFAGCQ
ncbi:helix-turn-helix transcriptional regulator [Xanthomonas translucens pv. secalis]|uniref:AraC family transcriptional regulator n=1 Tax=Xanthomonas campestris pv. translucens TaxID=343 RepID=UPI00071E8F78|nr:AraC family transcriptional regulator [Xanthomonas translucens]UKE44759.1 helix-turn-helix transcriptional regulator [Xanthomonas translucens pv. secalis]UPU47278.1 AraC family transcriptional regulator [Xanthomonas translucens pv. undulosa]WLA03509.1 AraC family transcriptional regulator [Xanthomonas translucens]